MSSDPLEQLALLQRIEDASRDMMRASPVRDIVDAGPFELFVDRRQREHWASFAVPQDGAEPTREDVDALHDAFQHHHRVPRVELLPVLCPEVPGVLLEADFEEEKRVALMVFAGTRPGGGRGAPDELELQEVQPDASEISIRSYDRVQRAAFGDAPGDADLDGYRMKMGVGGHLVAGRVDFETVATGSVSAPRDGIAMVGGVGTLPVLRRRGVASAVTERLVELALGDGAEFVILMAEGPETGQLYSRIGFHAIAEYVHFRAPERPR